MAGDGRSPAAGYALRVLSLVATAVLVALIVRVVRRYAFRRRKPIFEIAFEDGHLTSFSGPIPDRLRRDLLGVAREGEVSGTVCYFSPGEYAFSADVGEGAEQRFRNVLALTLSGPPTPG